MSFTAQRLLQLLPAVYALRDREQAQVSPGWLPLPEREQLAALQGRVDDGFVLTPAEQQQYERLQQRALAGPLASLLAVLAEQIAVLDEDISQLHDDAFIATCADWVVPYIGDLIGYRSLHSVSGSVGRARAEVAHTIGFRRRKGTLPVLEELAFDVTGWRASAAEFFQRIVTTQYMNHPRLHIAAAPDLRRWEPLARIGSAFDRIPRSVDVRRIAARRGRHNIPNIGLFVWRLQALPLTLSPAVSLDTRRWRFHPLGIDAALFSRPQVEDNPQQLAGPLNVALPLARRVLAEALADHYGDDDQRRSLRVHIDRDDGQGLRAVPLADVRVCHLGDQGASWVHLPGAGRVAIDPALGRLALPPEATPAWRVAVDCHFGFPGLLGGGEYDRAAQLESPVAVQTVRVPGDRPTVQQALDDLGGEGIVEITDSGRYAETLNIDVSAGARIELRAADGAFPTLQLGAALLLRGGAGSEVRLDGLRIAGHRLQVNATAGNGLVQLALSHCTLVPGWALAADGTPLSPAEPSIVVRRADFEMVLDSCVSGALRVPAGARISASDCAIDATDSARLAIAAPDGGPGAAPTLESCTVIGRIQVRTLPLLSNCIVIARPPPMAPATPPVLALLRQQGCVRFSWLPPGSRTPRRHRCLPDAAPSVLAALPRFTALRYGAPAYLQLAGSSGSALLAGADDDNEPGVWHGLRNAWRDANLRIRLDEYLRVGLEAGVFHET